MSWAEDLRQLFLSECLVSRTKVYVYADKLQQYEIVLTARYKKVLLVESGWLHLAYALWYLFWCWINPRQKTARLLTPALPSLCLSSSSRCHSGRISCPKVYVCGIWSCSPTPSVSVYIGCGARRTGTALFAGSWAILWVILSEQQKIRWFWWTQGEVLTTAVAVNLELCSLLGSTFPLTSAATRATERYASQRDTSPMLPFGAGPRRPFP